MYKTLDESMVAYNRMWDKLMKDPDVNIDLHKFIITTGLSKEEYSRIGVYTSLGSGIINGAIRSRREFSSKELENISNLNTALDKIPSKDNFLLFRSEIYDDTVDKFINGKMVGDEICLDYFVSTYQDSDRNPKCGLQLEIRTNANGSAAKDISLIGKSSEREALFKTGTKFKIGEIDRLSNKIIMLEL